MRARATVERANDRKGTTARRRMHGYIDASIDRSIETVREVQNGTERMG
jgi:hypothetical protein